MTAKTDNNLYDELPYPNLSHALTHPDRLATLGTLLGMMPPPVEQCRVLELGCAGGGNLMPMAQALPKSRFVGIELSARQVTEGQNAIKHLGLQNVTLKQMNILDVDDGLGQFDYIITHGVYSWVPPVVQDKILDICRQNLASNGIAYISYNTYPGWSMLGTLRQMMLYHIRNETDPQQQVIEARAFLDFLTEAAPDNNDTNSSFLYGYANFVKERILPKNNIFLLHDELSDVNEPVYFYQFAEQAANHDLQYLGDVYFQSMLASNLPENVAKNLSRMVKSTIELEQYMDFLRNRVFRRSLLCHKEVQLSARLKPEQLARFYFASSAQPNSDKPNIRAVTVEEFASSDGANLTTDHPVTKAALVYLAQVWPRCIAFKDLLAEARTRAGVATDKNAANDAQILGVNLLQAYSRSEKLVEFHVYAPRLVTEIKEFPTSSPVARFQAHQGTEVTNLRHERVTLDKINTTLLLLLDGSRNRAALLDELEKRNMFEVFKQDSPPNVQDIKVKIAKADLMEKQLNRLAQSALLIG